jgi:hypothetical protein
LPDTLAAEVEWLLKAQGMLLRKIVGVMLLTLLGCWTADELTPVRVWNKNLPSRHLGALPNKNAFTGSAGRHLSRPRV